MGKFISQNMAQFRSKFALTRHPGVFENYAIVIYG